MDYSKILNISAAIQSPESAVAGISNFLEKKVLNQELTFDFFINQDLYNDIIFFNYVRSDPSNYVPTTYVGIFYGGKKPGAYEFDMFASETQYTNAHVYYIDVRYWAEAYDEDGQGNNPGAWVAEQQCLLLDYYHEWEVEGEYGNENGYRILQMSISDFADDWGSELYDAFVDMFNYYYRNHELPAYISRNVQSHITCGNHIVSTLELVAKGNGLLGHYGINSIGGVIESTNVNTVVSDFRDDLIASKTYLCAINSSVYDDIADRLTCFKQHYETKVGEVTSAFQSVSEKFNSLLISCSDPWSRVKGLLGSLDTTLESDNTGFTSEASKYTGANPVSAFASSASNVLNVVGQVITAAVTTVASIISPVLTIVSNAVGQLCTSIKAATKSMRSPFDVKSATTFDDLTFNNQAIKLDKSTVDPNRSNVWLQQNRLGNHFYDHIESTAIEHPGEVISIVLPFFTVYYEMDTTSVQGLGRLPKNIYFKPHLYSNDLSVDMIGWYNFDYTCDQISKHFSGGADAFGPIDTDVSEMSRSERVDYENLCFKRFVASKHMIPYVLSAFDPIVHSGLAWAPGGYYYQLADNINPGIWSGGIDAMHFFTQWTAVQNDTYCVLPAETNNAHWFNEAMTYNKTAIEGQDNATLYFIACDWLEHFLSATDWYPYTWTLTSMRGAYAIKTDTENGLAAGYAILTISAAATALVFAAGAITCKTFLRRKAQKARLDADLVAFGEAKLTDDQYKEWRKANMKANFLGFLAGTNVDDSISQSVTEISANASSSRLDAARNAANIATDFLNQNGIITDNQAAIIRQFTTTDNKVDDGIQQVYNKATDILTAITYLPDDEL